MILDKASLTSSGRPVLIAGEVEKSLLDKVDLEFDGSGGVEGHIADRFKDGYVILTTHRVLWIEAAAAAGSSRSCSLPLSSLHGCRKESKLSGFKYKTRVELLTRQSGKGTPAPEGESHTAVRPVYLRCHLSPDSLIQALEDLLRLKSWRGSSSLPTPAPANTPGSLSNLPPPSAHNTIAQQPPGQWGSTVPQTVPQAEFDNKPQYNRQDLQQLMDMGFPRNRSIRALLATHNSGPQAAMDWIFAFGDQPGVDDPIDDPKPTPPAPTQHPPAPSPNSYPPHPTPSAYPSPSHGAVVHGAPPGYNPYSSQAIGPHHAQHPQHAQHAQHAQQPLHSGLGGMQGAGMQGGGYVPPAPPQSTLTPWTVGPSIPPPPQQVQPSTMPNPMWGLQHPSHTPPPPPSSSYPYTYPQQFSPNPSHSHASAHSAYTQGAMVTHNPIQNAQHAQHAQAPPRQAVLNVGVAGILNREEQKLAGTSRSMVQAFSDLKALMAMAGEMVKLAEKFRGVMDKAGGEQDDLVDVDTQLQLSNMGIVSPVTKETAGSRYHVELSKQLADFLQQPLSQAHGMLTLPDVYCLFNRARGTELVSPDDLLSAIHQFEKLGLPMRLRKFPSGVVVVQSAAHSDEEVCLRLANLVAGPGCGKSTSASEVAASLEIPLHIAQEHLLTAESKGVLCRDDAPAGIRFFKNFFMEVSV